MKMYVFRSEQLTYPPEVSENLRGFTTINPRTLETEIYINVNQSTVQKIVVWRLWIFLEALRNTPLI